MKARRCGPLSAALLILTALSLLSGCAAIRGTIGGDDGASPRHVFVQAHRGSTSDYPELTIAAFHAAVEAGVDRIEMDMALTADDHVVVMHDATVNRTTTGSGRVESFTLAELRELDAGSWHSPRFAGECVPTLREVIELIGGRAVLNLEIKTSERPMSLVRRTVRATVDEVNELDAADWVVYSSFDARALELVRESDPSSRLILIDWRPPSRYSGLDVAIDREFYGWTPSAEHISEERVRRAREAGLSVHVGAGPGGRALTYIRWGVDGLSSGKPQELVAFLEREGFRKSDPDGD